MVEEYTVQLHAFVEEAVSAFTESRLSSLVESSFAQLVRELDVAFAEYIQELSKLDSKSAAKPNADDGAFSEFLWRSAGWLAGGPLGAALGGGLGVEGLLANAAINFGIGWGLAALGLANPVFLIASVAVVGGLQMILGEETARNRIKDNVVKTFEEGLGEFERHLQTSVSEKLDEGFASFLDEVIKAIDGQAEDRERDRDRRHEALAAFENDHSKAEHEVQRARAAAAEVATSYGTLEKWLPELASSVLSESDLIELTSVEDQRSAKTSLWTALVAFGFAAAIGTAVFHWIQW